MGIFFFIAALLVKNTLYYSIYNTSKFPKYLFYIVGYLVVVISIGVGVFTLHGEYKGIVPMILNIDFFLLFFVMIVGLVYKFMSFAAGNNGISNPFEIFANTNMKLKHFYIAITIIQILLMLLCI